MEGEVTREFSNSRQLNLAEDFVQVHAIEEPEWKERVRSCVRLVPT